MSRIVHLPFHSVPANLFLRQSHRSAVCDRWSCSLARFPIFHPRHQRLGLLLPQFGNDLTASQPGRKRRRRHLPRVRKRQPRRLCDVCCPACKCGKFSHRRTLGRGVLHRLLRRGFHVHHQAFSSQSRPILTGRRVFHRCHHCVTLHSL